MTTETRSPTARRLRATFFCAAAIAAQTSFALAAAGVVPAAPASADAVKPPAALREPAQPPPIPSPDFSGPVYQAYVVHDPKDGKSQTIYLTFVFTRGKLTNIVPVPSEPAPPAVDDRAPER